MPRLHLLPFALLPFALALLACDEKPPTVEEVRATCEAQTTPEACAAVPTQDYPEIDESAWCSWVTEFPVVVEGDACSFGAATASCKLVSAGDPGCEDSNRGSCGPGQFQWSRSEGDMTVLGFANDLCSPLGDPCSLGGPECACFCDDNLPLE